MIKENIPLLQDFFFLTIKFKIFPNLILFVLNLIIFFVKELLPLIYLNFCFLNYLFIY